MNKLFKHYHQDNITAIHIGKAYFWKTSQTDKLVFGLFGKIIVTIQIKRKAKG